MGFSSCYLRCLSLHRSQEHWTCKCNILPGYFNIQIWWACFSVLSLCQSFTTKWQLASVCYKGSWKRCCFILLAIYGDNISACLVEYYQWVGGGEYSNSMWFLLDMWSSPQVYTGVAHHIKYGHIWLPGVVIIFFILNRYIYWCIIKIVWNVLLMLS